MRDLTNTRERIDQGEVGLYEAYNLAGRAHITSRFYLNNFS